MNEMQREFYTVLAKFLHATLGSEYEIVLHDFGNKDKSIIYIANSHISGRDAEDYDDDFILRDLDPEIIKNNNYHIDTKGLIGNNKVIKHSSFFIKDDDNNLKGMLCVNFNGSKYVNLAKQILQLTNMENASIENERLHTYNFQEKNNVFDLVNDIAESVIDDALDFSNVPLDRLNHDERLRIVKELNNREVFLLKGSIPKTADRLGISKATLYRYLQEIENGDE